MHGNAYGPVRVPPKDPDAALFYVFDWSAWLGAATIANHTILIDGDATLTQDHAAVLDDGKRVRVQLAGGTRGQQYTVTCRVTTNESPAQTDDRSIVFYVMDR